MLTYSVKVFQLLIRFLCNFKLHTVHSLEITVFCLGGHYTERMGHVYFCASGHKMPYSPCKIHTQSRAHLCASISRIPQSIKKV